jgi:hypothetical protein
MKRFWQVGLMALAMLAVMPTTQAQPSGGDPPEFSCEDLTYLIGSYQGSIDHINDQIASATASRDYWVTEAANRIARKVQLQTVEIPAAQAAYDAQVAYWEWCVSYHGHESQTTYDAMVLKGQLKRALDDLIEEMADLDGTQTNSESMAYAQHKVWIYNNILGHPSELYDPPVGSVGTGTADVRGPELRWRWSLVCPTRDAAIGTSGRSDVQPGGSIRGRSC